MVVRGDERRSSIYKTSGYNDRSTDSCPGGERKRREGSAARRMGDPGDTPGDGQGGRIRELGETGSVKAGS